MYIFCHMHLAEMHLQVAKRKPQIFYTGRLDGIGYKQSSNVAYFVIHILTFS